jgi:hypothetical protein
VARPTSLTGTLGESHIATPNTTTRPQHIGFKVGPYGVEVVVPEAFNLARLDSLYFRVSPAEAIELTSIY